MDREKDIFWRFSNWYFNKKVLPYWVIILVDTAIVFLCCMFTYWVTYKSQVTFDHHEELLVASAFYAVISWTGFRIFKTYSGILRYSSFVDLLKVVYANAVNLALSLAFCLLFKWKEIPYLSVVTPGNILIAFMLATLAMWAFRILVKLMFDVANADSKAMRALVYGALSGGVGLAKNIRTQRPARFDIRGFISHETRIRNMKLLDLKVYSIEDDLAEIIKKERIQAILVSPSRVKDFRSNQKMQDLLIGAGCKIFMVHDAQESAIRNGEILDEEIRLKEVSVEDLLPRSEIRVDMKSVADQLSGKRVLITGSAGSIGLEIVKQVAAAGPESMMLIDQAETPQHDVRLMMAKDFPKVKCDVVVCSISRRTRMEHVFEAFRPDYVFHAAAYKHVPMMEDNPSEAVLNNIYGTKIIADLSVQYGAKKFVMISTDKAVNPTNVMGCSKRICEIYVQSLDRKLKLEAMSQKGKGKKEYTQFVTTRFGNVLGSNGSVIPLFREQIRNGGPVTVTDERIVRFFMLIPEACKLVLEAGTKGNGGEIFVFDMGAPVKIADLAKRMIALSGAQGIEIKYTGLREGEKLYEEVLNEMENTKPTFHEKIRIAQVREYDYEEVSKEIEELVALAKLYNDMDTVRKMKQIVPEYKSNNSIYEQLDKEIEAGGGIAL
ncbi:MAG: polysaccharide biosynthesis protein [Bacteroidales bacterium]|nr:polysaccharide biosynthesis protein [Bacteroidales bacterium]MBQ9701571.1 polysaccharide biosynthesis protein [Bacteroidales bacterium]